MIPFLNQRGISYRNHYLLTDPSRFKVLETESPLWVLVEDTFFRRREFYEPATYRLLQSAHLTILGTASFLAALTADQKKLDEWILHLTQVEHENVLAAQTLCALRAIHAARFARPQPEYWLEIVAQAKAEVAALPTPEEQERQRQLAFFKSSAHDPESPWSPRRK
jgi:hypothetical protein